MTLAFADTARGATPASLGQVGSGVGFSGIPGVAVALDTYKNGSDPSANFVGISDGPASPATPGNLHWLATKSVPTSLRTGAHHVKVTAASGSLTVWIDGTQLLSAKAALPSSALVGFSARSGGKTDQHAVSHAQVSGPRYVPRPSLALRTKVVAPVGSLQASAQASYQGSCPSDFDVLSRANGDVARPGLDGAQPGQRCEIGVVLPPGDHWEVSAAVGAGRRARSRSRTASRTCPTSRWAPRRRACRWHSRGRGRPPTRRCRPRPPP